MSDQSHQGDGVFRGPQPWPWKRSILVITLLQVGFGLVYLETVPRLMDDEAWEASLGYSLAFEGRIRSQVMTGCGGMDVHLVQNRLTLPVVCAAIYGLNGFDIFGSRLSSVLLAALAICSTCAVMNRWFGIKPALWIGLGTIMYPWFFDISRRTRPEIYYLALAMAGLWCLTCFLDCGRRSAAVLAGLCFGLACLAHPTGCVLVGAIVGALFLSLDKPKLLRAIPWIVLGFAVASLPYAIYVSWAIRDPQVDYFEQMRGCRKILFETGWNGMLGGEVRRWGAFVQWPKGAPLAAILAASWLTAWYRSTPADKAIASAVLLFAFALPLTTASNVARTLAVLAPFFVALLVRLIQRLLADHQSSRHSRRAYRVATGVAIAATYGAICTAAISMFFYRLHGADLMPLLDRIASVTGQESRVYGSEVLWFGHDRFRYGPRLDYDPHLSVDEVIHNVREHRFDYAVRTATGFASSGGFDTPPRAMPAFRENAIDELCKRFGTKVDEFHDPWFGSIEVYRLTWKHHGADEPPGKHIKASGSEHPVQRTVVDGPTQPNQPSTPIAKPTKQVR